MTVWLVIRDVEYEHHDTVHVCASSDVAIRKAQALAKYFEGTFEGAPTVKITDDGESYYVAEVDEDENPIDAYVKYIVEPWEVEAE